MIAFILLELLKLHARRRTVRINSINVWIGVNFTKPRRDITLHLMEMVNIGTENDILSRSVFNMLIKNNVHTVRKLKSTPQ